MEGASSLCVSHTFIPLRDKKLDLPDHKKPKQEHGHKAECLYPKIMWLLTPIIMNYIRENKKIVRCRASYKDKLQ